MRTIDIYTFAPASDNGKYPSSICGIHIAADRPVIHIFELKENRGALAIDNILMVASAVRDTFFPRHGLKDLSWQFVKDSWGTPIHFREKNGLCYKIDIEDWCVNDGIRFSRLTTTTIAEYEAKNARKGGNIDSTFWRSSHLYRGAPYEIYPVPLPEKDGGGAYFKRSYTSEDLLPKFEVVIADSAKLIALWRKQTPTLENELSALKMTWESVVNTNWGTGRNAILLNMPIENSRDHIYYDSLQKSLELPYVHYNGTLSGPLQFTNGRHRLFNIINCGAPFAPLEMHKGEKTDIFKELFAWKTQDTPIPTPVFKASYPKYEF